ncbi:MAG: hypothetical protein K0R93_2373 [Anaerosolibacter sp.]|uniref:sensor histidine kinase n=1 Tax=Anaerosolibacter sp. TaxID=1872527 RepID=UPI002602C6FE|nr:sensor histidine kinase [Anaerosolibacter sp.]MDF2547475.1 hypothetical protein [Anaerosolibacter sp.]
MKNSTKHIIFILRFILLMCCFIFAIGLELPSTSRYMILILTFLFLLFSLHLKELPKIQSSRYYPYTYILDVIILLILEYNSKFLLNYYFHFIYFILMLSAGLFLSRFHGAIINIVIFLASMFKFTQILQINWNLSNVSLTIFTFFTSLLMIILLNYGKYYSEEQQKFKELYRELKAYADQIRELTQAEERNHLAMEIHDSIGHTMTGLIMELEMCKRVIPKSQDQGVQLIQHALDTAREGFVDIRRSVDALKAKSSELKSENWMEMIHHFRNQTGLDIHVHLDPDKIQLPSSIVSVVYRILQESLTNAARHGRCTTINITIQLQNAVLGIKILDNGEGCTPYIEGNGLKGMRQRVTALNGSINFSQTPGFCVEVQIPVSLQPNSSVR